VGGGRVAVEVELSSDRRSKAEPITHPGRNCVGPRQQQQTPAAPHGGTREPQARCALTTESYNMRGGVAFNVDDYSQ
jgi:hypothetical protein